MEPIYELTNKELEIIFRYLNKPEKELPEEMKDLSELEIMGLQLMLVQLEAEKNSSTLQ